MNDFSALLNQNVDAPMSTQMKAVPEGEYLARIEDFKLDSIPVKKGERAGTDLPMLRITWSILDEGLLNSLEREKVTVRQDMFLDIDPLTGGLDTTEGKNTRLGQLRLALGQNDPGKTWNLAHLRGAGPAYIKVSIRSDEKDPERKFNDVVRVAPLK
jgi:hypothetical protein